MKRIVLSFVYIVCFMSLSMGQNHLRFKGVPMDGTIQQFAQKLTQKGLTIVEKGNDNIILSGMFASYKDCVVGVIGDKQQHVAKVAVVFPDCDTWADLEKNYTNIKQMLTQKYGEPTDVVEKFQASYIDNDMSKMSALQLQRCTYYSIFTTEEGSIQLELKSSDYKCYVILSYFDNANQQQVINDALEDL